MGHNYDDRLATQMSFRFPQFTATPLAQLVPSASHDAVVLMQVHIMFYALYILNYSAFQYLHATIYPIMLFYISTLPLLFQPQEMMRFDPLQRPSLSQALQSPFFQVTSDLALSSSSDALRDDYGALGMNTNGFEHPSNLTAGLLYDPADPATHSPPLNENRPPENVPPSSHPTSSYNTTQYPTSSSITTTAAAATTGGAGAYNTHGNISNDRLNNSSSLTQLVAHIDNEPSTENTDFLGEIAGMLRESQQYQKPSNPVPASSSSTAHLHATTTGYNYNTSNNNTGSNTSAAAVATSNSTGTQADDDGFGDVSEDQFGFGAPAASTFSTSNRYISCISCIWILLMPALIFLTVFVCLFY